MKYIIQIGIISGISFVAEILHVLLPLPVPASVYGLLMLLILLLTGIVKEDHIKETADFLLAIMPLFFVPASVALITAVDSIRGNVLKLFVMCLVSTIAVMVVTGGVSQFIVRLTGKNKISLKNKEENPLLLQGQSHFSSKNKEENPLLLQGQSHFSSKNKEDSRNE